MKRPQSQTLFNLVLSGWLISEAFRTLAYVSITSDGIVLIIVVLVLIYQGWVSIHRKKATSRPTGLIEFVVPALATFVPLLFIMLGEASYSYTALVLQYIGAIGMLISSLSLKTNLAIFPMKREIVSIGIYRYIRHPLYCSYLIFDVSILLMFDSIAAKIAFFIEFMLIVWRIEVEESHLKNQSNEYKVYTERSPYKLFPFLY